MHTLGPWTAEPLRNTKQVSIVPHYDDCDRRSVASVVCVAGNPPMDFEANARLIAAAPKLLEALEEAMQEHTPPHESCSVCIYGWAAIAEAKGE